MAPTAQLCDPAAARAAFEALSAEGAAAAPELRLERGAQILREDALVALERALGRPLALEELVAAERAFALDAGAVLGRAEFEAALGGVRERLDAVEYDTGRLMVQVALGPNEVDDDEDGDEEDEDEEDEDDDAA